MKEKKQGGQMQDSSRMSANNLGPAGITFPNEIAGTSSISADCEANAPSHAHTRLEEVEHGE
jgi:hypothetical protein